MKKNVQRILATILTVIMMISMLPSNVFAADFDADMFVEPAVEAVSVPAEEQEVESTVEYIYEEPAETLQGSSDEIQTVEAADPAADEIEEETEAPVVDGTVTLKAEGSDYTVTVTYDVSAGLPADADIKVKEVMEKNKKYDDYVAQAADTIASDVESLNYVRLFDITLVDAAGNDLEPDNSVDVQIQLKDVVEVQDTTQVVHFAGEEEVPEVVETAVEGDTVSFTTDGFSVYAVVDNSTGGEARLEVTFDLNGGTIEGVEDDIKVYVKADDITDNEFDKIVYNPGTPEATGKKFMGWTDDPHFNSDTTPMDFDAVREDIKGILQATEEPVVHDLGTKTYYAMMFNEFELCYKNEGNVLFSAVGKLTTDDYADITIEQEYTVTQTTGGFAGWVVEGTVNPNDDDLYTIGETIRITTDTTLVPWITEGHWLHYNGNDGGSTGVDSASYTKSVFIPENVEASVYVPVPPVPTRNGYRFLGWYTDSENGQKFDFDQSLTDDTTIYAHWEPAAEAEYTVIVWAQSVDDHKDAADDAKTYDYVKSQSFVAETGTQITEQVLAGFLGYGNSDFGVTDLRENSTAFKYSRFKVVNGAGSGKDEVSALGDTVVNVYYDRELMTIQFRGASEGGPQTWYEEVTNPTASEVYALVDGEYVLLGRDVVDRKAEWVEYNGTKVYNPTEIYKRNASSATSVDAIMNYSGNANILNSADGTIYERIGLNNNHTLQASSSSSYTQMYLDRNNSTRVVVRIKYVYGYTLNGEEYTGPFYEKKTGNALIYTGLYGQQLSKYGYTWPDPDSTWWSISYLGSFTGNLFGDPTLDDDTGNSQGIPNTIKTYKTNETINTTLVFYVQDPDVLSTYNRVATAGYRIPDDDGFNITERFLGADPVEYAWSNSLTAPTSGWVAASGGYTSARAGSYLHIHYNRVTNDIVFMLGSKAEKTIEDVPYGKSLSSYEAEAPDKPATAENMYFAGWFEDPEGTKEVDWSGTMPLGNMVVYGVTKPISYHVMIEMNAEDGETVSFPASQSPEFWLDYNETIDGANLMRATKAKGDNQYSIIAYYTKNAVNGEFDQNDLWNFEGSRITEDLLFLKYTGPDDPNRVAYHDNGYDGVQGVFKLYASWRDDSLIKNGIGIKYVSSDGSEKWDNYRYADQATVIVGSKEEYMGSCPEGKRFAGWKLSNGDTTYLPGQTFVATKGTATLEGTLYNMTLVAQYEDIEEKTPSHINWYWNDGRGGNVENQIYYTTEDVEINKAYDIPAAPEPEGPDADYAFLGWALADEKQSAEATNIRTEYDGEVNFLKYDNGEYTLVKDGAATKTKVTQIAADEVTPYHGLYAVWGTEYSIYHSSDSTTDTYVKLRGNTSKTVNLVDMVKGDNIYGGYFHYENETKGQAYTDIGLELKPVNGTTYYLKEVDPTKYLLPNIYVTWLKAESKELRNFYVLADTDEAQYSKIGVYVDVDGKRDTYDLTGGFYDKLKLSQSGTSLGEFTTENIFGYAGVFGMSMKADAQKYAIDRTLKDKEITLTAYYTTLDGVTITGTTQKKYNLGDQTYQNWAEPGIRAVESGSVPATNSVVQQAIGAPAMAYRGTYQLQSEPEISKYVITKIDNGKTITQEVQAGDNTGKITYAGKTGYVFAGWYLDKSYNKPADFAAVESDMTVYAKYVKTSAIALSFTKMSSKSGSVTLKVQLKVSGASDITDVVVDCDYKGKASAVKFTGVKTTKSGKTTINTYTGTVAISGLANKNSFSATVSYRTPDGTTVNLADKTCKYVSGSVTVK